MHTIKVLNMCYSCLLPKLYMSSASLQGVPASTFTCVKISLSQGKHISIHINVFIFIVMRISWHIDYVTGHFDMNILHFPAVGICLRKTVVGWNVTSKFKWICNSSVWVPLVLQFLIDFVSSTYSTEGLWMCTRRLWLIVLHFKCSSDVQMLWEQEKLIIVGVFIPHISKHSYSVYL